MSAPLPIDHDPRPLAVVVPFPDREVPLVSPGAAADLLSVSRRLLWVEYLTLGGGHDLERFLAHLHAPDPCGAEHEVVLETIEAVLADERVPVRVR